jgi:hypothetical protein
LIEPDESGHYELIFRQLGGLRLLVNKRATEVNESARKTGHDSTQSREAAEGTQRKGEENKEKNHR